MFSAELTSVARTSAADGVTPWTELRKPLNQPSTKYWRMSADNPAAPGAAMLVPELDSVVQLLLTTLPSSFAETTF